MVVHKTPCVFVLEHIGSGNVRLVFTVNYLYLNGKYSFQISIVKRLQSRVDNAHITCLIFVI